MKPVHVLAALVAVLSALFAVPTLATETPGLSTCREGCAAALRACKAVCSPGSTEPTCRVPCPEQYARCAQRCAVRALRNCDVHVLIDGSGGRGVPISPDVCDAWGMTIRGHFGLDVGLGFAGGLDVDYLPRLAAEVRSYGASIDAEGRLRDGDEGGTLSLDKVRAYLAAAGEVMSGAWT